MKTETPLNRLYKYDTQGRARYWDVEVSVPDGRFRTLSGLVDGAEITSDWVQCEPKNVGKKNATSPVQQAFKEARSAWNKKVKEGYHTDIEKSGAQFFEPMLAQTYSKKKMPDGSPAFIQPKLDGMRCLASRAGLFSRTGEPIVAVPHIWEQLKPIFDEHPDLTIDGELYTHTLRHKFQKLMSICRKEDPTPEQIADASIMEYHVYDCFLGDMEQRAQFSDRWMRLLGILQTFPSTHIKKVTTRFLSKVTEEKLWVLHDADVANGYEGMMVRDNCCYQSGKRSKCLLKMKSFDDDEYTIMAINEGKTKGKAETVTCISKTGHAFFPTIAASDEDCEMILKHADDYIGKQATVRYQGFTDDGIPRFPVAKALHAEHRW
jgi:DNA ligase-1